MENDQEKNQQMPGVSREDAYTLLDERLSSVTQEPPPKLGEAWVELRGVAEIVCDPFD